ncbi:MAG: TraB/GumN family protein [Nanoarchaeota archaeon]
MDNLRIIGTSHISKKSIQEIKNAFLKHNPDIICVELDQRRYLGLISGEKRKPSLSAVKDVGLFGYLFLLLGSYLQKKLGDIANVNPGEDMHTAITLAKENSKPLVLIDRDILITLHRLSKKFTAKEKWRLFADILTAPFSKKKIRIDLTKVPPSALITQLLTELKSRYPNLYLVLVHERNLHMAAVLYQVITRNPGKKILAVVGAGHEEELLKLLEKKYAALQK